MDFLILGVNGMAGHVMALYLQKQGHCVVGLSRRKSPFCTTILGDATNESTLISAIESQKWDAVINCIGVLNQRVDENIANGVFINSYLPHRIAALCEQYHTKLVHLSTDCVFSGHGNGGYTELSPPDATSNYGRSKALGEVGYGSHLTFRTSIVGPDCNPNGIGLFNWFMKQSGKVYGYSQALWTGVSTITLAKAVEQAVYCDLKGLFHLVNGTIVSKYELLTMFAKLCVPGRFDIVEDNSVCVNKTLVNRRLDFPYAVPTYEEMIGEIHHWIIEFPGMYSHYEVLNYA